MRQDGAADDGQIGVRAQEVVGEMLHKIKQAAEALAGNLHRHMLALEYDAVFVVVGIGGVLQIPTLSAQRQGHDAMVLAGGKARTACVAWVFHAEHALGIARLFGVALCGDIAGILLRLGKVDGDLQFAAGGIVQEGHVLCDAIHANVIHIPAKIVKILGGCFGPLLRHQLGKAGAYNLGMGSEDAHHLGGKQIALLAAVGKQAALDSQVHQLRQYGGGCFGRSLAGRPFAFRRVHAENLHQTVQGVFPILNFDQLPVLGIIQQRV